MKALRNLVLTLVLLGVLGAGGWFGYNQLFQSYDIERTYRAGETWEYAADIDADAPTGSQRIKLVYRIITEKVEPDGSATLRYDIRELTQPGMSSKEMAQLKQMLNANSLKVKVDSKAKETIIQGQPLQLSLGSSTPALYPPKPVRKGQEWEYTETQGGMTTVYKTKVVGIESRNGRECYKLISNFESPSGSQIQVKGSMTAYIDQKMGWVLAVEGPMTATIQGSSSTLTTKMNGKRVANQSDKKKL